MAKTHAPRCGSLAYSPRKRARKQTPRIHHWPTSTEAGLLGFAGYKAGMTHVMAVDKTDNSITHDLEVFIPVTIIETPPLKIVGARAYVKKYTGKQTLLDVIITGKKAKSKKKNKKTKEPKDPKTELSKLEGRDDITDVTLIVETQPDKTKIPKKKPDVMEIALGGELADKISFAKEKMGAEVKASEILTENTLSDVTSVTKGKGTQGPVKRWGITLQPRKATGKRRHIGSGGAWTPTRKLWREPQAGQMGYHTRTEYNKLVLKVGENPQEVTPKGGFLKYGPISSEYVIIYGSLPGPIKRLVRFSKPRRAGKTKSYEITQISTESKQGT